MHRVFGDRHGIEAGPECCFIIPLRCGVYSISVLAVINFATVCALNIYCASREETRDNLTVGVISFAVIIIGGMVVILVKFFWNDSAVTRNRLTLGCLLMMTGNIVALIGTYIGVKIAKILPGEFLYAAIGGYLLLIFLWLYFRKVC